MALGMLILGSFMITLFEGYQDENLFKKSNNSNVGVRDPLLD